jgi:hypothetical protein
MSWWSVLKKDYRNDLSAILENFPQTKEAYVEMDYGRDFCCENARARIVEVVGSIGHIITSTGKKKSGKEAAEHVAEYDCDKLRRFLEVSLSKGRMIPEIKEEAKQILEDWKDCEGDESGY